MIKLASMLPKLEKYGTYQNDKDQALTQSVLLAHMLSIMRE